jgi:SAM-dependent methyltransferase
MTEGPTRYDAVQYPSGVYGPSDPSRLAAIARLHGLAAPDPGTARVLEIAGGDGINLAAMASGTPQARYYSFDLAPRAVERGRALAAGIDNCEIAVGDLLECADSLPGPYDYVIAHGLYAWVPAPVRQAALRLIGRVLAPDGIALISYNAMPGGYLRQAVRAMLLQHVGDERDPARITAMCMEKLTDFVVPRSSDSPALAGLRHVAKPMLNKRDGLLFHDELSETYAPHALSEVVAAAQAHGLAFLNDAIPTMICDGLPGRDVAEADVVALAQADDYEVLVFFHQTLFVRPGRKPARGVVAEHFRGLFATTSLRPAGPGRFMAGDEPLEVEDERLAEVLTAMATAAPWRVALDTIADSPERCEMMVELVRRDLVTLYCTQLAAAATASAVPRASPLALAQLRQGFVTLHSLDLRTVAFAEPGPRYFLSLLDGTRDRADLARDWAASPYGDDIAVDDALHKLARAAMLVA